MAYVPRERSSKAEGGASVYGRKDDGHFELIPDRLPDALRARIAAFPPAMVQFELGIQTFDADVTARIQRRQDNTRVAANLRWLREHTGVHVHADLIVGLPGEGVESFARNDVFFQEFDLMAALGEQVWSVGIYSLFLVAVCLFDFYRKEFNL